MVETIKAWISEHKTGIKRALVVVACFLVVVVVVTACSTLNDVGTAQFGISNTVVSEKTE